MKVRLVVRLVRLFLSFAVLFATPGNAWALNYFVAGWDETMSNPSLPGWEQRYYWTGAHGWFYTMSNPTVTSRHVNSIYIRQDVNNHGYEVGWDWIANREPHYFVVTVKNGVYKHYDYDNSPRATNHSYSINIESNLQGAPVNFLVDGVLKRSETALYPDGRVVWGSERNNTNESNYGHFWNLYKRRHDFVWVNWGNMSQYADNDPSPWYDERSNTEAYSTN